MNLFETINLDQKYTKLTVNHPVFSRIAVQNLNILNNCNKIDKESKNSILTFCFLEGLMNFEVLWDIQEKINDEYFSSLNIWMNNKSNYFPSILGLRKDVNLYLYTFKNILRDLLLYCFNSVWNENFTDGSAFSKAKDGISPIRKWMYKKFGKSDFRYDLIQKHEDTFSEIIMRRNASEHPNGKSGILKIFQPFIEEKNEKFKVTHPRWCRNNETPTSLINDLPLLNYELLRFTEEFIIFVCLEPFLDDNLIITKISGKNRVAMNGVKYITIPKS